MSECNQIYDVSKVKFCPWSTATTTLTSLVLTYFSSFSLAAPASEMDHASENMANTNRSIFVISNRLAKTTKSGIKSLGEQRAEIVTYGTKSATKSCKTDRRVKNDSDHTGSQNGRLLELTKEKFFQTVSAAGKKPIVLFVHGYNCNLNVPYSIAARLEQTLELPVVMFSWPSKRNPFTYSTDECNAEWSSFQLAEVLKEFAERYGNENIILVGHSMGCRILYWALQRADSSRIHSARYRHILFCAPDMDSQIFEKSMPLFVNQAQDTSIFASRKDIRLYFSKVLHGNSRLGLLSRTSKDPASEKTSAGEIRWVDYTAEDKTIFGHAIPYQLLKQHISNPS